MEDRKQVALQETAFRTDQLQFLRFLAFINVFIAHGEQWLFFRYPAHHCATSAVSFFFVLSGLLTGYYAYGKKIDLSFRAQGRYMWKKISRIYPLYALVILFPLLTSGLPELIAAGAWETVAVSVKRAGINLAFLQSWFVENPSYNGSWFMSTLMFLYLFNLPGTWLLNRLNEKAGRWVLLVGAMLGAWFMLLVYCYLTRGTELVYWHYTFPPARLGEYLVGMAFGFLLCGLRYALPLREGAWKKVVFTILELAVLLYWFRCLSRLGNYWRNQSERWLLPNLLLLGVFTLGEGWVSCLFRWKPLARLGDVSFECYLIHKIILALCGTANEIPGDSQAGKAAAFLMCMFITVGIALLVNRKPTPGVRRR